MAHGAQVFTESNWTPARIDQYHDDPAGIFQDTEEGAAAVAAAKSAALEATAPAAAPEGPLGVVVPTFESTPAEDEFGALEGDALEEPPLELPSLWRS